MDYKWQNGGKNNRNVNSKTWANMGITYEWLNSGEKEHEVAKHG